MARATANLTLALLIVLAGLALTAPVRAQSGGPPEPTADEVNRIAKQLYCPVCPNTPLDVCETKACQDWRAQIKDQLAAGWSEQQIIDYFVAQYGERVLAEPRRGGFTSLVWLLPVVALAIGLAVVWQLVRTWRAAHRLKRAGPAAAGPAGALPDLSPAVLARLERELEELR
jgi:cytochrome c-type biogenesis protein CcmH